MLSPPPLPLHASRRLRREATGKEHILRAHQVFVSEKTSAKIVVKCHAPSKPQSGFDGFCSARLQGVAETLHQRLYSRQPNDAFVIRTHACNDPNAILLLA